MTYMWKNSTDKSCLRRKLSDIVKASLTKRVFERQKIWSRGVLSGGESNELTREFASINKMS